MIIETLNSIYRVDIRDNLFHITKDSELAPSPYNSIGQTRISPVMSVMVGVPAQFDTWHTSKVVAIRPIPNE